MRRQRQEGSPSVRCGGGIKHLSRRGDRGEEFIKSAPEFEKIFLDQESLPQCG